MPLAGAILQQTTASSKGLGPGQGMLKQTAFFFVFQPFMLMFPKKFKCGQVSRLLSQCERPQCLPKKLFFTLTYKDGFECKGYITWSLGREVVLTREIHRKHWSNSFPSEMNIEILLTNPTGNCSICPTTDQ